MVSYAVVNLAITVAMMGLSGVIAGLLAAWWTKEETKKLIDMAITGLISGITDYITFVLLYCLMLIIIEVMRDIISVWQYHSNVSLIVMEVMLDLVGMMMPAIIYIPMVFIGCIGALILSLISSTVYAVVILKKRDL